MSGVARGHQDVSGGAQDLHCSCAVGAFPSASVTVHAQSAFSSTADLEVAESQGSSKPDAAPEDIKPLSLCLTPSTFFQSVVKILLWFLAQKGKEENLLCSGHLGHH